MRTPLGSVAALFEPRVLDVMTNERVISEVHRMTIPSDGVTDLSSYFGPEFLHTSYLVFSIFVAGNATYK